MNQISRILSKYYVKIILYSTNFDFSDDFHSLLGAILCGKVRCEMVRKIAIFVVRVRCGLRISLRTQGADFRAAPHPTSDWWCRTLINIYIYKLIVIFA